MGGPRQYDLGDLFRALLPPARTAGRRVLETAFQKGLAAAVDGFDLEAVRILSHAAARSGFNTVTHDLATAIEGVAVKMAKAEWTENEKAAAYLATDQIIASLAAFAFDGNRAALRVSRVLYGKDFLAPFSSSLFTPLALEKIELWPVLWLRLVNISALPSELFGQEPQEECARQIDGKLEFRSAHFDIFHVFEDLIVSALAKGYAFQEIYDATFNSRLKRPAKALAESIFVEMERRGFLMRRPVDDGDEIFVNPTTNVFKQLTNIFEDKLTAKVEPKESTDWKSAAGSTPKQFELYLQAA